MELLSIDVELIIKLIISAFFGLIIGIERELKKKPLGLKTSLVISIISCLITIVSIESAYVFPGNDATEIRMDPLRLAAQIVSGIGFLGAGVILRRDNDRISGLTTAAMIWGAAGIGIAVGAGFYIEATVGVLLLMISVEIIPLIMTKIGPKKLWKKDVKIKVVVHELESVEKTVKTLKDKQFFISHLRVKELLDEKAHLIEVRVKIQAQMDVTKVYTSLKEMDDVKKVEIIS